MPTIINAPAIIPAVGKKPKAIEEFIERVNSNTEAVSIARMKSPGGWTEPGQTPEFDDTNARILDFGFWIDQPLQEGTLRVSICSLPKQKRLHQDA
jgi:hypothetical protein